MLTVLIIEDDNELNEYLCKLMEQNSLQPIATKTGSKAIRLIDKMKPDLILLDLGLPDLAGESLCQQIRKNHKDMKIIILTGKDSTKDIVNGLELGADDYITKPFSPEVLMARIKARLRTEGKDSDTVKVGDLVLNRTTFEVKRGEKPIRLTSREFKLLEYLMVNHEKVLTRDMILNRVWMLKPELETRSVDVYIGFLRKKIDAGFDKKLIKSVRGFGYTLKE